MNLEEYVKKEFETINDKIDKNSEKIDKLMIFMAVSKAEEGKKNKHTAAVVAIVCSVASSGIMLFITKMIGG